MWKRQRADDTPPTRRSEQSSFVDKKSHRSHHDPLDLVLSEPFLRPIVELRSTRARLFKVHPAMVSRILAQTAVKPR
jgi:hypothetical protein